MTARRRAAAAAARRRRRRPAHDGLRRSAIPAAGRRARRALVPLAAVAAIAGAAIAPASASAAPHRRAPVGALDPGFGGNGQIRTGFYDDGVDVPGLFVQDDGKLVALGVEYGAAGTARTAIERFTAQGRRDATLHGVARPDLAATEAAALPGGGYVAGGAPTTVAGDAFAASAFGIIGLRPDSTAPPGFAAGLLVGSPIAPARGLDPRQGLGAIAAQPDGKVLAAGVASVEGTCEILLVRFTSGGKPDPAFGDGGHVLFSPAGLAVPGLLLPSGGGCGLRTGAIAGIAVQRDGRIVVAGSAFDANAHRIVAVVSRFDADGSPDATFGIHGHMSLRLDHARDTKLAAVGLQSDGAGQRIVLLASTIRIERQTDLGPDWGDPRPVVVRLDPQGKPDRDFGRAGAVAPRFGSPVAPTQMAILRDGRILVAGSSFGQIALARLQRDGAYDRSFGGGRACVQARSAGRPQLSAASAVAADARGRSYLAVPIDGTGLILALRPRFAQTAPLRCVTAVSQRGAGPVSRREQALAPPTAIGFMLGRVGRLQLQIVGTPTTRAGHRQRARVLTRIRLGTRGAGPHTYRWNARIRGKRVRTTTRKGTLTLSYRLVLRDRRGKVLATATAS